MKKRKKAVEAIKYDSTLRRDLILAVVLLAAGAISVWYFWL